MNRADVAQKMLDLLGRGTYFEIGVWSGESFLPIHAHRKIAVDVRFVIPRAKKMRYWHNLFHQTRYYEMPSDEFFLRESSILEGNLIDVALVDGLHQYEQAFRDVENTLRFLKPNGVIVMHDCNPATEKETENCGDVWRTVMRLRASRKDISTFVLDCDYGLGIVMRRPSKQTLDISTDSIASISYSDFAARRKEFLDLRPPQYLDLFLERLAK